MKNLLLILLLIPAYTFAQDQPVDENALFSDDSTVIENRIQDNTQKDQMDSRSLGISGSITGAFQYTKFDDTPFSDAAGNTSFRPFMVGDLYIDARMPGGYKGFWSFELEHDASKDEGAAGEKQTTASARELFVDFNFGKHVYFRTGKQVLQWGQCYLWNPTDMINIENKSFLEKLQNREGTYGVKMHIPFGTVINIYGFAGMDGIGDAKDISGAGKFEFLISGTEMAFSVWGKRNYEPVYGYDFSGRLLGLDIKGEASYSRGSNTKKIEMTGGFPVLTQDNDASIFKAALNIGRDFDFGEKTDRINVSLEFFYNGDGYSDNPLEDQVMALAIVTNGLYQPNYLSKYYAAMFITVNEFIISDMALTLNAISNITHKSYIASAALSYTNINNFTAGLNGNCYLGSEDGEYRAAGLRYDVMVRTGIAF